MIGALRDFPVDTSVIQKLVGTKALAVELVNNRNTRGALKSFTRVVRQMIRAVEYGRTEQVKDDISVKYGRVYFRMGALMQLKGVTKKKYGEIMTIARWYCHTQSCLCVGKKWCDILGHVECTGRRSEMEREKACSFAASIVSRVFCIGGSGTVGHTLGSSNALRRDFTARRGNDEHDCNVAGVDLEDVQESSSENDKSSDEVVSDDKVAGNCEQREPGGRCSVDPFKQWVFFKIPDCFMCTEILESLLENIQFGLGEPITLGFLPYFTHNSYCSSVENGVREHGYCVRDVELGLQSSLLNSSSPIWDDWSRKYQRLLDMDEGQNATRLEKDKDRRKQTMDLLTEETEQLHKDVSTLLKKFALSELDRKTSTMYPCERCSNKLDKCGQDLLQRNTTVAVLVNEVVRSGKRTPILSRESCSIAQELIDGKLADLDLYKKQAEKNG